MGVLFLVSFQHVCVVSQCLVWLLRGFSEWTEMHSLLTLQFERRRTQMIELRRESAYGGGLCLQSDFFNEEERMVVN